MKETIKEKSYLFSIRIVKLCNFLQVTKREHVMTKQLLRAGTSIGANVAESQQAQSRPDFIHKLNIALKEAAETNYWLRLLFDTDYLTEKQFKSIYADCTELERMLTSIVKHTKE